jgi:hypothetical protein
VALTLTALTPALSQRERGASDEAEAVTGVAGELPAWEVTQPDLRSGQVGQDGHRAAEFGGHVADDGQSCLVLAAVGVGHVQAKHVDPGGDQFGQLAFLGTGRPDGGDDLGLGRAGSGRRWKCGHRGTSCVRGVRYR